MMAGWSVGYYRACVFCVVALWACVWLIMMADHDYAHAAQEQEEIGEISVDQAYIRAALIPGRPAAVYMVITNNQKQSDRLIAASSPISNAMILAKVVRDRNGLMTLESLPHIVIAAGERVSLMPGGLHLLMVQPQDEQAHNSSDAMIPITLTFLNSGDIHLHVPIVHAVRALLPSH